MRKRLDQLFPAELRREGFRPHLSWKKELTALGHPSLHLEIFNQDIDAGVVFADKPLVLPFNAFWQGFDWSGNPFETELCEGGLLHSVYYHFVVKTPQDGFDQNRKYNGQFRDWQHLHTYYGVYVDARQLSFQMMIDTLLYRQPPKLIFVGR